MQVNRTTIDGITYRWEEHGEGTPVVLVHGLPTNPRLWRHVVPRLGGARCLAWEMVGYGHSIPQGIGRDIGIARQADYLHAWMSAIGIERAILCGHDVGGGVVQVLAARHPESCAGIFLANSIAYDAWPGTAIRIMHALRAAIEIVPAFLFRFLFRSLLYRGHDDPIRAYESMKMHWPPYARYGAVMAMVRQIRCLRPQDLTAVARRLPLLSVPARVLWGMDDASQPEQGGQQLARDLHTRLRRIDGARTYAPEDHPGVVADSINELLQDCRARPLMGTGHGAR